MVTENPRVGSSILSLGTRNFKGLGQNPSPFCFSSNRSPTLAPLSFSPIGRHRFMRTYRRPRPMTGSRQPLSSSATHLNCSAFSTRLMPPSVVAGHASSLFLALFPCKQPPVVFAKAQPRPPAHGDDDRQEQEQIDEVQRVGSVQDEAAAASERNVRPPSSGIKSPLDV